jgi:hypothetical protein
MARYSREQVTDMLITRKGDKSLRGLARELGVSAPYLSDIFLGRREPGPKILVALNLRKIKTVTYQYVRNGK